MNVPVHFKPVTEIDEDDIEAAWEALSDYMNEYDVSLAVCSPNISTRELYWFTTEELFDHDLMICTCQA